MSLLSEKIPSEQDVEQAAIGWLQNLGYSYLRGTDISSGGNSPEREDYRTVVLKDRLANALRRLNPDLPQSALDDGFSRLVNPSIPGLLPCNRKVHEWLTDGIRVLVHEGGQEFGKQLRIIDFDNPQNNDWLVVNQFTVKDIKHKCTPDVVVFVNGLPLAVFELKAPMSKGTDIWAAFNQLQTYKEDIPDLFKYNVCLIISDMLQARMGSLSADAKRFMRWRTIGGGEVDPLGARKELQTLINGVFRQDVFLNYLRYFCLFEEDKAIEKKIASYHQFDAVQTAVGSVIKASTGTGGEQGKGGVVWHTQGAGKSIEMAYLAGWLVKEPQLKNPTLVMVTDRLNLDGQLFGVFASASRLLGGAPEQANSRAKLRDYLKDRPSGGILFTTIQKFGLEKDEEEFPVLSERENIVVIADEAHRTQYGLNIKIDPKTGQRRSGMARSMRDALPNATFLAFTGTPISQRDRDTRVVFGDYLSTYGIQQAVEDGATVPIYYQSRRADIKLNPQMLPEVDERVEEILDSEAVDEKEKARARRHLAALANVIGAEPRLKEVAQDIVMHYETRCKTQPGKAMVVAMSREICVRLYDQIIAIKPEWHSDDLRQGVVKVVMTADSADDKMLQKHRTSASEKKEIERRFKDPHNSLKMVIVCDMWLTGFDVPCLATMYVDKPMQGANLAQAIARVNRVFKDKPGGLVVDYIGIAQKLKAVVAEYKAAKAEDNLSIDSAKMLPILQDALHKAREILKPLDWSGYHTPARALELLPECINHILGKENGKRDYCDAVLRITRTFALCSTLPTAAEFAKEIAFHQAIRVALTKTERANTPPKDYALELQDIFSELIEPNGIKDIFQLSGLEKPDISILSDEFLQEMLKMPHKNIAVEVLRQVIDGGIKSRFALNGIKQRKFSELLIATVSKYTDRPMDVAYMINDLFALAKRIQANDSLIEKHGLTKEGQAFYDALVQNDSAMQAMGEEVLVEMAREIEEIVRENATVDWTVRDSTQAHLRALVRALLTRRKYPPEHREEAVEEVIRQAKVISEQMEAA